MTTRTEVRPGGTRLGLIIVIVALAMIPCTVVGVAWWWLYGGSGVQPASDATNTFLGYLEHGNDEAAYRMLCQRTRLVLTRSQFAEAIERLPRPHSYRVTDAAFRGEAGREATVTAELTDRTGSATSRRFDLVDEGAWTLCGRPFEYGSGTDGDIAPSQPPAVRSTGPSSSLNPAPSAS